jgi:hypothetical protein
MSETASVANYNTLQKKSVALIAASKHVVPSRPSSCR